jgi:hypothetical protein
MLWDGDDTFGRWVQLLCVLPLLLIAGACLYITFKFLHSPYSIYSRRNPVFAAISGAAVCFCLAGRCLRYAITGKNNINRDDF